MDYRLVDKKLAELHTMTSELAGQLLDKHELGASHGGIPDIFVGNHTMPINRLWIERLQYDSKYINPIDTDFIKYCITTLGSRDNRGKKTVDTPLLQEIQEFYTTDFQPINNNQKHQLNNLSYTLPYVCSSIEVSITNNIKEHFAKRLSKFISIFGGIYYDKHYKK
jgi:hypothetical protein